jgi:hypothetical protein
MARGRADKRGFEAIRRIRLSHAGAGRLTLAEFKTMMREQYFVLLIDEPRGALAAIPALLPADIDERRKAFEALREMLASSGRWRPAAADRLERVAELFSLGKEEFGSNPVRGSASKTARVRNAS